MPITMKVIVPRVAIADPKRLLRAVENTLTQTAKAVKADFGVTTKTWKERPEFTIEKSAFKRVIATDDDVYRYVSRGTSIRYAVMSADFRPKTRTGWIGSNKGKGGMVGFNMKHPRPGIKAREFEEAIHDKWQKELPAQMQRAIDAEFQPK